MSDHAPPKTPAICDECGTTMNHHAMKIDYSVEAASDDPVFGGALQEVHTCPQCGHVQLRQA